MKDEIAIPKSMTAAIARQSDRVPEVLTPEERAEFIDKVEPQFRGEAQQYVDDLATRTSQDRGRLLEDAIITIVHLIKNGDMSLFKTPPVSAAVETDVMTTGQAASYLRHSTSWLLKRNDIPYIKGLPNIYQKKDLDAWLTRHKIKPRIV